MQYTTNKELSKLLQASKVVLEYQDFQEAAMRIFNIGKELTGAKSGYVALLSDDGNENEVLFLDSGGLPCSVNPTLPMPIRGLRAESYKTNQVVYDNSFVKSEWVKFMPKGHVVLNNVMFAPLILEGKTIGIMGLANKDGDFNEHDAEIARTLSELAAIALNNSRMLESLEESNKNYHEAYEHAEFYKELFAHDISNILQNISTAGELLNYVIEHPEKKISSKKILKNISEQVTRASNLIANVRKISSITEESHSLIDIDALKILNKAKKFVQKSYPEKEINISICSEDDVVKIKANDLLMDVFENVLFNAVKHNLNEVIEIDIDITKKSVDGNSFVVFQFQDNGIGIPDPVKKQLFTGNAERNENVKGMGLGLLLINKIVKSYNGKIEIKDRIKDNYTKGSNFVIKLPKGL